MEFGSSHVYAGADSEVYYSSVPKEKPHQQNKTRNDADNAPSAPVYELISSRNSQNEGNQLGNSDVLSENIYDSVPEELSTYNNTTAWDEIPNKKPPIPTKPDMYRSSASEKSNGLSLSEKLRQALKKREENIKNNAHNKKLNKAEIEILPVAPVRKKHAKKNDAFPPSLPPRDDIETSAISLKHKNTLSSDTEWGTFDNQTPTKYTQNQAIDTKAILLLPVTNVSGKPPVTETIIPALKPPSNISRRKTFSSGDQLSADPFGDLDPFGSDTLSTNFCTSSAILQPTILHSDVSDIISISTEVSDNSNKFLTCESLKDSIPSKTFTQSETNPFSNCYKPGDSSSKSSNPYLFGDPASASFVEQSLATSAKEQEPLQNPFLSNFTSLFPDVHDDKSSGDVGFERTNLEPTAPFASATLVRSEAEFLQNQLNQTDLLPNTCSELTNDLNSPSTSLLPTSLIRPSAPHLSSSMIRRDANNSKRPLQRANSLESVYSSADTNIVCVKLGIVGETRGSFICQGVPSHCLQCGSIMDYDDKKECIFCGSSNKSEGASVPAHARNDVTYVLQPSFNPFNLNDRLVVFCIDTSGSMCVTSEVDSALASGSGYISRMQALQQAIVDQINLIEDKLPNCRVAIVTFNNEVQLLGDGSPEQLVTLTEYQLFDFDFLCHVGFNATMPGMISATRMQVTETIGSLKPRGGTALGPALLLSTSLASKLPGSQVIVCTDGRANVGVGSLELESDYEICHHFYDQATNLAASTGVIVSIVSIAGSDCRLVQLGKIADKTSGKVNVVEASKLSEEFGSILSDDVLATNVSIDLITHPQLCFNTDEGAIGSCIGQFIGNITNQSEVTFRYGIQKTEEFSSVNPPQVAPFQLKIMYRSLDGSICMRVLNQSRPVTENRRLAESKMNPAVIGAYASQSAARLALEGDVENAQQVTSAHKNLLERGISLKSHTGLNGAAATEDAIYESVRKKMNEIGSELSKVDRASSCSSENLSQDSWYGEVEPIEQEVYEAPPDGSGPLPPALPPRRSKQKPSPRSKIPSVSSLESMLAKLPAIPKGGIKKKKKKEDKEKTAMQYKDETAKKMFSLSKASTTSFASVA